MKLLKSGARDDQPNLHKAVEEGEARVGRQIEAIRRLMREGHAAVASDARSLAIAWKKKLEIARRDLAMEQQAQGLFSQER